MVKVSDLIVAIIGILGGALAAGFTAAFVYFSAKRRRNAETERLVHKYGDPVRWAAHELQSWIYDICDNNLLNLYSTKYDLVVNYTCYLPWKSKNHKDLIVIFRNITETFASSRTGPVRDAPFMIWRGQQSAIGEIMTVHDADGERVCVGYAEFTKKLKEDKDFKEWFVPIIRDMDHLGKHRWNQQDINHKSSISSESSRKPEGLHLLKSEDCEATWVEERKGESRDTATPDPPDQTSNVRLTHLQHLLLDLIQELDLKGEGFWDRTLGRFKKVKKLQRCQTKAAVKATCKCKGCKAEMKGKGEGDANGH